MAMAIHNECAELMNWLSIQSRYVVVGNPRQEDKDQSGLSLSQVLSPGRMREMREGGNRLREGSNRLKDGGNSRSSKPQPKPQPKIDPEGTYLSIYKTKVKKKKSQHPALMIIMLRGFSTDTTAASAAAFAVLG